MNRFLRALTVVLLFEMGALLLYLPWSGLWDRNYLLNHMEWLKPVLLHPSVRGMVSGLGVLDILAACGAFSTRAVPADAPPETKP